MKVHYWDGRHIFPKYPVACGKQALRWRLKFWQQRKWKGVTCKVCLRAKQPRRKR